LKAEHLVVVDDKTTKRVVGLITKAFALRRDRQELEARQREIVRMVTARAVPPSSPDRQIGSLHLPSNNGSEDAAYPSRDCHRERPPEGHASCGAKHISAPKVRSYCTQCSKKNQ
jgi:hypothetical protein